MDLIFEDTKKRNQCGSQSVVEGLMMQCPFSTSRIVTIPAGVHYFEGKPDFNENALSATIYICKNHEMRLKNAFQELVNADR